MTFLEAPGLEIEPGKPAGVVRAPASKSLTNRTLLVAALAGGTSVVMNPLVSDDAQAMRDAVSVLGAGVADVGSGLRIEGVAGGISPIAGVIDARLSGTTLRFVGAAAALSPRPLTVGGEPGLLRRPIGPLTAALRSLGADVTDHDGFPPLRASGGLTGGRVTVDVRGSSQFASAVLLAAPYASGDVEVIAEGGAADAYIDMTADLMRRWGARVERTGVRHWTVRAGHRYRSREEEIEHDASAAAHLLAVAVATGGTMTVTNATAATLQPDAGMVEIFAAMGASVRDDEHGRSVRGPAALTPVSVDMGDMPDQVPTVACLAILAQGRTTITGAAVTRGHETDRLAALATELPKLGVAVDEHPDGLTITGGHVRGPARLFTYDDHRLAMAFAAVAAAVPGVVIENPGCVAKTYPGFWSDIAAAGLTVRSVA